MATAQVASRADLEASTFQRLHPRAYFERFIAEGYRPDGRKADSWRDVSINVGSISTANGSALVRIGDSTIVCGVKAEIAEPDLERPDQGFIGTASPRRVNFVLTCPQVPNLDLPAICSPKFRPGPPAEEAQMLSERINDILVSTCAINPKTLCIHPGKSAWVIYIDAVCINYDGNILDATMLAVIAALQNGMLMTHLLSDPSSFEEPLLDATITVIVDISSGTLSGINQIGFSAPDADLETLTLRGMARSKVLADILVQSKAELS
ncbi:hypothetical protein FRC07_005770 [Ceratobasidium sp. 392]|nr:hypothetical protein FRC07_005770 [Ceratobasidium sp. 392]